jgi:PPOX class probable F420-dependent enzyme
MSDHRGALHQMAATLGDDTRDFLTAVRYGTMATVSPSGIPHQVLVWYVLDGDEILISTPSQSYKVGNIRANPWVSLSVSDGPRYITVRGRATIDENIEIAAELYRQIATRYLGEEGAERWISQPTRWGVPDRFTVHLPIEHIITSRR